MSHTTLREADREDQQIKDIPALQRAAVRCGLEFKPNQNKFHSYATDNGRLVGDSPMPQGMTAQDYISGNCLHAIGIPADRRSDTSLGYTNHYEIGVIESRKFPGTYSLAYDSWGRSLEHLAGKNLDNLLACYHAEAARGQAQLMGDVFSETVNADGTIDVEIDTTCRLGF